MTTTNEVLYTVMTIILEDKTSGHLIMIIKDSLSQKSEKYISHKVLLKIYADESNKFDAIH